MSTATARSFAKPCANWRDRFVWRRHSCPRVDEETAVGGAGTSPARSPPLILFLFPHEITSGKVRHAARVLPAACQLRPARTAAAAIPRTTQAARGSARQPQRQSPHAQLERAHA